MLISLKLAFSCFPFFFFYDNVYLPQWGKPQESLGQENLGTSILESCEHWDWQKKFLKLMIKTKETSSVILLILVLCLKLVLILPVLVLGEKKFNFQETWHGTKLIMHSQDCK